MTKIKDDLLCQMQNRKKDAYGCGEFYQDRAYWLSYYLRIFSFIGLVFFLLIGSTMAAFGANPMIGNIAILPILLTITGVVGIGQTVLNVWMLVHDWSGNAQYAMEAASDHHNICRRYDDLLAEQDDPPSDWEAKLRLLQNDEKHREDSDRKHGITQKNKAFAHRKSLLHYREECLTCKITPVDMTKTKCASCGVF